MPSFVLASWARGPGMLSIPRGSLTPKTHLLCTLRQHLRLSGEGEAAHDVSDFVAACAYILVGVVPAVTWLEVCIEVLVDAPAARAVAQCASDIVHVRHLAPHNRCEFAVPYRKGPYVRVDALRLVGLRATWLGRLVSSTPVAPISHDPSLGYARLHYAKSCKDKLEGIAHRYGALSMCRIHGSWDWCM